MADIKMVKKANVCEILNHWLLAVSFFILTASGFSFLFQMSGIGALFGGFNQMRVIHNWSGVVFLISLFLTIFNYLPLSLSFSREDIGWLRTGGGYLSRTADVPPQDAINAGQKLFYLLFLALSCANSASGLVIWLRADLRNLLLTPHLIHNLSFDLLVIMMPLHIYLATLANPGTYRIMLDGKMPLAWARQHHGKWVKKMGWE